MSLLNDALRAAEQRQGQAEVSSVYTGQAAPRSRGRPVLWTLVLLLAAGLGAALFFWYVTPADRQPTLADPTVGDSLEAATASSEPEPVPSAAPQSSPETVRPEPEIVDPEPPQAPLVTESPEPETSAPQSPPQAVPEPVAEAKAPVQQGSEAQASAEPVPAPEHPERPAPTETANAATAEASASLPQVKQVRETPEAIDRRVSRELASLLRGGETVAAEQRLQALVAEQAAPASREVFARQMLVQGMPERALAWLPAYLSESQVDLRLLRARALHATGDLEGALSTLEQEVPPVAVDPGYRVTLATMLQQAGRSTDAARHWSLLIAEDDSRAAWWVGLGIALETGGETDSAVRAYTQAAQLPGLSPSLAEYVRERLRSLQAG